MDSVFTEALNKKNKSKLFNGDPPDRLEVRYRGDLATGSPMGRDQTDLLSAVMHELGHMIGINYTGGFDTDYDFAPHVAGGARVAANEAGGSFHLRSSFPLMGNGGLVPGERQMPSATDILAMYDENPFKNFDLPRVEFIGGNNAIWNSNRNWIGGQVPDLKQEAFINHGGRTTILNNTLVAAKSLTVGDDGRLDGSNVTVTVNEAVNNTGSVVLSGRLRVGERLFNNGRIAPRRNGVLTLETNSKLPVWNLGAGRNGIGTIEAFEGDLVVNGLHQQPYYNRLLIGPNHSASFNDPFTLAKESLLLLKGRRTNGSRAAATLGGEGMITLEGPVVVDGTGVISAPFTTRRDANIQVPEAGDWLNLASPDISLAGGKFTGKGLVRLVEGASITGNTTVNVTTFDWDGPNEDAVTTIQRGGSLTIASDRLEQTLDGYDGTVTLRGGQLNMQTGQPWRLEGSMSLHELARVTGDEMIVAPGGVVEIREMIVAPGGIDEIREAIYSRELFDASLPLSKGGKGGQDERIPLALIDAPQRLEKGGVLRAVSRKDGPLVFDKGGTKGNQKYPLALEYVALRGTSTLAGGSIQGPLNLFQMGNLNVESDSSINITGDYYLDGITRRQTTTIAPGVSLNLRVGEMKSYSRQPGKILVQRDAILKVEDINDTSWTLDKELQLKRGSTLSGDDLEISSQGYLTGAGTLQDLDLFNAGTVAPGARFGALTIDGDYTQTDSGEIMFQLGGPSGGRRYDKLLADTVDLAGTISVELLSGYTPNLGDQFKLLVADSISGVFTNLDLLAPAGIPFNGRLLYEEGAVVFEVLAGSAVRRSGVASFATVPEPTGCTLILFGTAMFGILRCRVLFASI